MSAMRSPLRTIILSAASVIAMAALSLATIVVRADVARLAKLADVIIDGTVESRQTTLDRQSGAIWTTYRLRVSETLAGTHHKLATFHVPGGEVDGLSQEISGVTRLEKGERAVLFLAKEEDRLLVLGQAQGCFRVTKNAKTGALMCRNDVAGLVLVGDDGKRIEAAPISESLKSLRAKVRAALDEKAEEERLRREEEERRLDELRKRAERNAELMRGKPGGGE